VTGDLLILQIVVPLLSAPICLLLRPIARYVAIAAGIATFAIAWAILGEVIASGAPLSYELGGFARQYGIEYRVDYANAFVILIVSAIGAIVLPAAPGMVDHQILPGREYLFFAAFLLCLAGLLGVAITGDAFNVFVFLEISSLSAYILISLGDGRRALLAAFSYLVMGTIGGTFVLIGIGFMYQLTGTLNMAELSVLLPSVQGERTALMAFAFLTVGIAIKLAVFPLHQWLPSAYAQAPTVVTAFLAATATKVAYYLLLRVTFTLFGATFAFGVLHLEALLLPVSLAAMFTGSIAAIYQTDLKRLLAYSSIAQIGYMTLGLSLVRVVDGTSGAALSGVDGLTGGIVHLFNHAVIKGGLFLLVLCIVERLRSTRIVDLRGLGRRMPITMGAFVIAGLSLVGVPGTAGFVSKWYLVLGALEQGSIVIAALILLSSLLALIYVWRIVEVAYFQVADGETATAAGTGWREARPSALIPACTLVAATVYFGLFTDLSVGMARRAAMWLMVGHI
jgi:multicomponent Na+:H+ antiporter subunit D